MESENASVEEVSVEAPKSEPKSTGKQSSSKKMKEPAVEAQAFPTFERPFSVTRGERKSVQKQSVRKSASKVEKTPKSAVKTPKTVGKQSAMSKRS